MSISNYVLLKKTFRKIKMNVHPSERAWSRESNLPLINKGRATSLQNVKFLILAVAAAIAISGCDRSFSIREPKDGSIIESAATTKVIVEASPSMSNLIVRVKDINGNVTYVQMKRVSDYQSEGDLSLSGGNNTITAQADVPFWNKVKSSMVDEIIVCKAEPLPSNTTHYTAFSKDKDLSWKKTSDTTIGVNKYDEYNETRMFQWNFIRASGIFQKIGKIQPMDCSCLYMRPIDDKVGASIGFAFSNAADTLQLWELFEIPNKKGYYRVQNFKSRLCLTDDNGKLIQTVCQDTDNQLWRFKNNLLGFFESPF